MQKLNKNKLGPELEVNAVILVHHGDDLSQRGAVGKKETGWRQEASAWWKTFIQYL
jgi:hypothetical protein